MSDPTSRPVYRMPPEWYPHESTWISWPHNVETWPDHLEVVEKIMAQAVRALLEGEHVDVNVIDPSHLEHVRLLIGDSDRFPFSVRFHIIPTNDAWCRDHGAIFVTSPSAPRKATAWGYNAWGGKYPPFDLDEKVAIQMAEVLDDPVERIDMILEGGSIEVDERGRLMTTASCLLNPNRNPDWTRDRIEATLSENLGVRETIWMGGDLAGDDTDGHIDNLARFVGENIVVAASESDPVDPNYDGLQANLEQLRAHRFDDGSVLQVVEMPMPDPVYAGHDRLPASYCNFYIGNSVVLLPTYGCVQDQLAAEILQSCFRERRIVSLDCRDVVRGLGAFHCLTQQVPVAGPGSSDPEG